MGEVGGGALEGGWRVEHISSEGEGVERRASRVLARDLTPSADDFARMVSILSGLICSV